MPDNTSNNTKPNQIDLPNSDSADYNTEVEMFADQLANLLWSQWVYKRELENSGARLKTNSDFDMP